MPLAMLTTNKELHAWFLYIPMHANGSLPIVMVLRKAALRARSCAIIIIVVNWGRFQGESPFFDSLKRFKAFL